MIEAHEHDWIHAADQPAWPTRFTCTECEATATGCTICDRPQAGIRRTCDRCISATRDRLRKVRDMYRALPDVIAAAAGLHAVRYDRGGGGKTKRSTDVTVIGGAAAVMAGAGSTGTVAYSRLGDAKHVVDQLATDPPSVLGVLTGHEDDWRIQRREPAATVTSVDAAVEYLVAQTQWAALSAEPDSWYAYLADLRDLHGRLVALTGGSNAPVKAAAPCMYCGHTVTRAWGDDGLDDVHTCTHCGTTWASEARFLLAVRDAHQALPQTHPDGLVTIDDAKRIWKGRVRPARFDEWVNRGSIRPAVDEHGRQLRDARGRDLYRLAALTTQIGDDGSISA